MLSWRDHPVMDDGLSLVDAIREGDHEEARFLSGRVLELAGESGLDGVVAAVSALTPCLDGSQGRVAPTQMALASLNLLGALLQVQYGF